MYIHIYINEHIYGYYVPLYLPYPHLISYLFQLTSLVFFPSKKLNPVNFYLENPAGHFAMLSTLCSFILSPLTRLSVTVNYSDVNNIREKAEGFRSRTLQGPS